MPSPADEKTRGPHDLAGRQLLQGDSRAGASQRHRDPYRRARLVGLARGHGCQPNHTGNQNHVRSTGRNNSVHTDRRQRRSRCRPGCDDPVKPGHAIRATETPGAGTAGSSPAIEPFGDTRTIIAAGSPSGPPARRRGESRSATAAVGQVPFPSWRSPAPASLGRPLRPATSHCAHRRSDMPHRVAQ